MDIIFHLPLIAALVHDFVFKLFQFEEDVFVRQKHFTKFGKNSDDPDIDLNGPIAIQNAR